MPKGKSILPRVMKKTESARFWGRVILESAKSCWFWTGAKDRDGYGLFRLRTGKMIRAHVYAFLTVIGDFDRSKDLHHDCDYGCLGCVNPFHLSPLTRREHVLISNGIAGLNSKKTHCLRGHPLSGDNLYVHRGRRMCKTCQRARNAKCYQNKKHHTNETETK